MPQLLSGKKIAILVANGFEQSEMTDTNWVDQECVIDRNRITSRKPEDIPAFYKAMIELLSKK